MRDHQDIAYEMGLEEGAEKERERCASEIKMLRDALMQVFTGGNHLASVLIGRLGGGFADKYPPDLDHESALRMLHATEDYELWCCWAAMMRVRENLRDIGFNWNA